MSQMYGSGVHQQGIGARSRGMTMIYTVYKGVGRGMGAVARELHETVQAVTDDIMCYRSIALNCRHFDDT